MPPDRPLSADHQLPATLQTASVGLTLFQMFSLYAFCLFCHHRMVSVCDCYSMYFVPSPKNGARFEFHEASLDLSFLSTKQSAKKSLKEFQSPQSPIPIHPLPSLPSQPSPSPNCSRFARSKLRWKCARLVLVGETLFCWLYIIEGSLEVKLPTIWTDEKQSRAEAERRERLEERRVEEKE